MRALKNSKIAGAIGANAAHNCGYLSPRCHVPPPPIRELVAVSWIMPFDLSSRTAATPAPDHLRKSRLVIGCTDRSLS